MLVLDFKFFNFIGTYFGDTFFGKLSPPTKKKRRMQKTVKKIIKDGCAMSGN